MSAAASDWTTVEGRAAHVACVRAYNDTIACGIDRGDCGDAHCCISARYDGPPAPTAQLIGDLMAAWLAIPRAERARRLGQDLSEREDGACVRASHDDGVLGSGVFGHVPVDAAGRRAALAMLVSP